MISKAIFTENLAIANNPVNLQLSNIIKRLREMAFKGRLYFFS